MTALPDPLREVLAHTVDAHLDAYVDAHVAAVADREYVLALCTEAVAFAREFAPTHVGSRASRAAGLLFELCRPDLDEQLRRELAVACQLVAIGAAARRKN